MLRGLRALSKHYFYIMHQRVHLPGSCVPSFSTSIESHIRFSHAARLVSGKCHPKHIKIEIQHYDTIVRSENSSCKYNKFLGASILAVENRSSYKHDSIFVNPCEDHELVEYSIFTRFKK